MKSLLIALCMIAVSIPTFAATLVDCETVEGAAFDIKIVSTSTSALSGSLIINNSVVKFTPVRVDERGYKVFYTFKIGAENFTLEVFYGAAPLNPSLNAARLTYAKPSSVTKSIQMQCAL